MVEYMACQTTSTICEVAMSDLISMYDLVEADIIEVQVSATNMFGTSDLSIYEVDSAKRLQTVPHKPSSNP